MSQSKLKFVPEGILVLALALIKLALHFLTNTNYELHRDVYLYLALADHPAWGYVSVPPLTPMIGKVALWLLGHNAFAAGFFPALTGALTIVIIALLVKELGGGTWALVLACTAFLISPAFLRSNTFLMPVSFDQFAWLLSGYLMVKLIKTQNPRYWIWLGLTWGLAFLNKYAIVFFVLAALLALLLTPQRNLIRSKHFVAGVVLGTLIILPNLLWQHSHNWPVIGHMAELRRTQLVHVEPVGFLLQQLLMNLHAVPLWLAGLFYLLFAPAAREWRALGLTCVLVILILMALSGKAYYTLGAYPLLFAAGGVAFERLGARRGRVLRPALLALMILLFLPGLPYSLPLLSLEQMAAYAQASRAYGMEGALVWEDGRVHELPQDYADMTGWRELAEIVIRTYDGLSAAEKAHTAIYAENYGQAGAIKFYGKKRGLPEPVSFNESFVLWAPDSAALRTLIYVNDELGEDLLPHFANIELAGQVNNRYFRENGVQVYLCRNPRDGLAEFYRSRVASQKNHYR